MVEYESQEREKSHMWESAPEVLLCVLSWKGSLFPQIIPSGGHAEKEDTSLASLNGQINTPDGPAT